MHRHPELPGAFLHLLQESLMILVVEEDQLSACATLDQMMGLTRNDQAGQTGHGTGNRNNVRAGILAGNAVSNRL